MRTVNLLHYAYSGYGHLAAAGEPALGDTMARFSQVVSSRFHGAAPRRGRAGLAIVLALQLGAAVPAMAATYYVDNTNPGCLASGPGSVTSPYCTISAAVSAHPGAGNTILVVAGTYREQVSIPGSGVAGSPFVIQAGGPAVTVDGADDFSSAAQWAPVSGDVWLAASVTWAPKQVFADGARLAATTVAPASMPARTFQYVAGIGLYVNAGGGNPANHATAVGRRLYGFTVSARSWVTVRGFNVTRAEDKGIQVQSASSQCEISDNRVTFNFKYGIQVAGSTACLVARNASGDNGGHGIALTGGSSGCTVEDNESYRNADPLVRVANGLYLFGAPSNVIQRNRYHDNQDSGQHLQSASNSCLSIQNRSWSNGDHGYDHLGSTGTLHVGDVAWGNRMDGFSIEGSATGTQLFNCIATDNGLTTGEYDLWVELSSVSGFVSDYNLFWNSNGQPPIKYISTDYAAVTDYSTANAQDAETIQADPRFVNPAAGDFRLQAGSPAIDDANSGVASFPVNDARGFPRMDDPATGNAGAGPVLFADRGALEYPPTVLAVLPSSGAAPLAVTANATGSLGPDGTVASYRFDFGDGTIVGPQAGPTATHTFSPGEWTVTVTVTDGSGGTGTATAPVIATLPSVTPVDRRVAGSSDDAEESASAKSSINGTDLDLVYDKSNQTVGMRWTALDIPAHAIIRSAFIQFSSKDARSEATSLTIRGQAADNAATFTTANGNVSSRPRTTAGVSWAPPAWARGVAGADQRTPDLSAVVDEIVNRPGWTSGNALALIATGTGHRVAWSYDGSSASAPLLHVEYTPNYPPVARLTATQAASPALTVTANASASTDTDPAPIASYRFTFGDGSAPVTTTAPTATAPHTYAAAGVYTITLTATDTRGLASAPVSTTITVNGAPTARLSVAQIPSPPLTARADASASTDPDPMPIASYRFDFGDGTPAVTTTAPNAIAQHAYAAPGTYTVRVTATDTGGLASVPATASITMDAPPVARLTVTQVASPALTMNADASASTDTDGTPIASYRFDFGDGTAAVTTTAAAQHTYTAAGVYTISLIATDTGGYPSAPATASVTVNGAPTARLTVAQLPSPPLTARADASASTDPDPRPIASYQFDFGDGTPVVTTSAPNAIAQHAYAAPGTYTVRVTATDTGALISAPATASITMDAPPVARLAATQLASPALTGRADASASTDTDGTPIASYRFDFGDGTAAVTTTAPTAIAQHTYAAAGVYTLSLTATDTGGYTSAPATASLTVNGAPTARLTVTTAPSPPLTVNADASASTDPDPMPIASYRFDFGDGTAAVTTTAPAATAQHTYAAAGTYTVRVTATDAGGLASAPATASTTVDIPPIARLTVTTAASPPLTVNADASASTDTDGTPIASYRFDFGDGTAAVTTTAPAATAQHTYASAGS
jgi:PKD repeat protein